MRMRACYSRQGLRKFMRFGVSYFCAFLIQVAEKRTFYSYVFRLLEEFWILELCYVLFLLYAELGAYACHSDDVDAIGQLKSAVSAVTFSNECSIGPINGIGRFVWESA